MKRYSPSQTETFLECPRKRAIRKLGWEPTRLGKPGLARILGTAFAAGVGAYNLMRREGLTPDAASCADIAFRVAQQHLADADAAGLRTGDADLSQRAALPGRARTAILNYAQHDPIPTQWRVLDVELTLPEWGNARIDLGYENDLGVGVLDYKSKLTLYGANADKQREFLEKDIQKWKYSEQRWFYPDAYGEHLQRPVHRFDICLVVLEPRFQARIIPFMVNPQLQAEWRHDREGYTWPLMEMTEEDGPLEPGMAAVHFNNFGPCEFERYCFDFKGDPNLAATSGEYVKRETT